MAVLAPPPPRAALSPPSSQPALDKPSPVPIYSAESLHKREQLLSSIFFTLCYLLEGNNILLLEHIDNNLQVCLLRTLHTVKTTCLHYPSYCWYQTFMTQFIIFLCSPPSPIDSVSIDMFTKWKKASHYLSYLHCHSQDSSTHRIFLKYLTTALDEPRIWLGLRTCFQRKPIQLPTHGRWIQYYCDLQQ